MPNRAPSLLHTVTWHDTQQSSIATGPVVCQFNTSLALPSHSSPHKALPLPVAAEQCCYSITPCLKGYSVAQLHILPISHLALGGWPRPTHKVPQEMRWVIGPHENYDMLLILHMQHTNNP